VPLALAVENGEAVGKVGCDGVRRKLSPLGIGQRLAPLDIATEEQLGDEHALFGRRETCVRCRRQYQRRQPATGGEQQYRRHTRHRPDPRHPFYTRKDGADVPTINGSV
jgi:hypothetical protein